MEIDQPIGVRGEVHHLRATAGTAFADALVIVLPRLSGIVASVLASYYDGDLGEVRIEVTETDKLNGIPEESSFHLKLTLPKLTSGDERDALERELEGILDHAFERAGSPLITTVEVTFHTAT